MAVLEKMLDALNGHDLEAFLALFDADYDSEQPAHPNRGFGGKDQVRKNWSRMFEGFPDLEAEVLRSASGGGEVWGEWRWRATGLHVVGVIVMGVEDERILWARLYMEPVEEGGEDIDEAVGDIVEPGAGSG